MSPGTKVPFKNTVKIHSVFCDLEGSHEKHDNVIIFSVSSTQGPFPLFAYSGKCRGFDQCSAVLQPESLQPRAGYQSLRHF